MTHRPHVAQCNNRDTLIQAALQGQKTVSACRNVEWGEKLTKKVQEAVSRTDGTVLYFNCVVTYLSKLTELYSQIRVQGGLLKKKLFQKKKKKKKKENQPASSMQH